MGPIEEALMPNDKRSQAPLYFGGLPVNRTKATIFTLGSLVFGLIFAARLAKEAQAGPLNPPPGPVQPTSPSLPQIQTQLDAVASISQQVLISQTNQAMVSGPYQFLLVDPRGLAGAVSQQVLSGRNYIHSVYNSQQIIFLYDGPGRATNTTRLRSLEGKLIGFSFADGPLGSAQQLDLGIVVENGLQISKFSEGNTSDWIAVYYKPLP